MSKALITFVAPAFNEHRYNAPLVDSLMAQKDSNWNCIVYNNGPNPVMREWIDGYKDKRLLYWESAVNSGNWGCANRESAVKGLISTPYCINTSVQDYYIQDSVSTINKLLEQGADFVHWQGINHLFRYQIINGEIAWGHIDWGQWCVKTEYIKQTGIVHPENFSGDWHTLQEIISKGLIKNPVKIDRVLTIHN